MTPPTGLNREMVQEWMADALSLSEHERHRRFLTLATALLSAMDVIEKKDDILKSLEKCEVREFVSGISYACGKENPPTGGISGYADASYRLKHALALKPDLGILELRSSEAEDGE